MRFHDLRHSAASSLFPLGVEPKTISEVLGYSTTAVTLETCTHVRTAVLRDAADRLEAALTRAQDSREVKPVLKPTRCKLLTAPDTGTDGRRIQVDVLTRAARA
jgi:hypothetical protein